MVDSILSETETAMEKAIKAFQHDISRIRTGRASAALVEEIMVQYYGSELPLNQVGTITIPEPRLIVIQPWDRQAIPAIEKAILKSELGITPTNDGTVVRLTLPQLSEERRKELVRLVRKRAEEARVEVRNHRRRAHDTLRKQIKEGVSEDEVHRAEERLQKTTDQAIARVDALLADKEQEIMTV